LQAAVVCDFDIAGVDAEGGRPIWLAPPSEDEAHAKFAAARLDGD